MCGPGGGRGTNEKAVICSGEWTNEEAAEFEWTNDRTGEEAAEDDPEQGVRQQQQEEEEGVSEHAGGDNQVCGVFATIQFIL